MTRRTISDHDLAEVGKFAAYLYDIGKLSPREFVNKHKEYMGLTDDEAEAYIRREERLTSENKERKEPQCK